MASIERRLEAELDRHRGASPDSPRLSLSLGYALLDPAKPATLDDLIASADRAMYRNKRPKRVLQAAS